MKKHTSEEAQAARMRNLAGVNQTSVNESKNLGLGTLIDFERAANGVAYGIVKEQHKYYIKKGGLNENLNVADFAYIGGLGNVTEYQYTKLAEAKKNRNFLLQTVNEGVTTKVNPNGSKTMPKKKMLTEDKAGQEIEMAASKVDDLDAATAAAEVPAEPVPEIPADDGAAEMDAGLDAMDAPVDGAEMAAGDADMGSGMEDMAAGDADLGGAEMAAGEEEIAAGDAEMGDEVAPEGGDEVAPEGGDEPEDEATREIEKSLGKITNTLRKTELTDSQVISYVKTFLAAFKEKFPDIDIEDRKEMAERITKVVPPEDIEDLGQNVEDSEVDTEITPTEPEEVGLEEKQGCAECGGFAQYAESRGYTAESIQECGAEEMTNLVSGYANAHGEGQNDGDFKAVAIFITPEIIEKLKGEYGHDEYADQVEPFSQEMNEEDKSAQIAELFGGLRNLGKAAGQGIAKGAQAVGQGIANKAGQVSQAVGNAATAVKQTYHAGELGGEVKKLEKVAADLGKQIGSLNSRMQKAGKQPINVASILTTIKNQVGAGGAANLGQYTNEEDGIPVDHTEVQPMMEDAAIEEDVTVTVNDKKGKPLSSDNVPVKEMKEGEEVEGDDVEDIEVEDDVLDLTKEREKPNAEFGAGFEAMGGGVVKPEGAEITTVEVTKDSVKVEMNESEAKLRTYIRNRLQEHAGLKKPSLNESKKSEKLQKLDRIIDKQFGLYESEAKKKVSKEKINEVFGWSMREKFAKIDPNNPKEVGKLFYEAFRDILNNPQMGAIYNAAKKTPNAERYNILKQFVEQGGGTLRTGRDTEGVVFAPKTVKNIATKSAFSQGGTQGKTQLGGV